MSATSTLAEQAEQLLQSCRAQNLKIAIAESCTGGMIAAILTDIAGSSDVFERGYVTYSNEAKTEMLGVPAITIIENGAVSEPVARLMACGALLRSRADIAVSVTGIAGPGGGTDDKPVGLVHLSAAHNSGATIYHKCLFGDKTRSEIRHMTVEAAFGLLEELIAGL